METEKPDRVKINRIVIVEDNDNVAKLIAKSLSAEGFETKVISFGSAAVFYAMEKQDCLLLMEYQLPDMTAKEVITTLKNNKQNIPFIIMSPPGNEKIIIEMMKMGARDYLVKEQGFLDLLPSAIKRIIKQIETEYRLAEAERSLRFSEDKFIYIFHSITDAIFIYDLQGNILEVNKATIQLLGYDKERLLSMNFLDLHHTGDANKLQHNLADIYSSKQQNYESLFVDLAGQKIPVECISRLIEYDNQPAILTFSRDISERKKAEDLLRQNEERLQRITNTMTDYIFTVYVSNGKPQHTVHSPACLQVTGYTPEELSKNAFLWIDMVDARDRETVIKYVQRILAGEQIPPYEHRILRKDGKQAWLRNTPVLHYDQNGKLFSYDGVVQDITERKLSEVDLLEKQAQLSAIVDAFDGLIYVCSDEYKIEYMNEKFIKRTGYNPVGEMCYKTIHDLDAKCPWCVNDRIKKGETVKWEVQSPKDNRWYYVVNTPIFHFDGRISKQSLIIDISDKKFADNELNRLNKLYFSLLEELDYPVCRFMANGSIISANQAFLLIFSCSNDKPLIEQSVFSCIPEQLGSWTEKNLTKLDENRSLIKKTIKNLVWNDFKLNNKVWAVMAIFDSESNILEYQAVLRESSGIIEESELVLTSS